MYQVYVKIDGMEGSIGQEFKSPGEAYAEYNRIAQGDTHLPYTWVCIKADGVTQRHQCVYNLRRAAKAARG